MGPKIVPQERALDVRGLHLHYLDWGGEGPPAVCLHATGFHAHVWDPIARALSARGFRVYALDARGHGDSEKPESGYDWSVLIDDAAAVLDALGIRGALGIGHSLGATITAGVAASRPGLYGRIVLVDPILFPREPGEPRPAQNPMAELARKRREIWSDAREIYESYRGRPPFETWLDEALRAYVDHGVEPEAGGGVRLKCPGRIEAQVFSMALDFDGWAVLDRIDVPVLLVRGESSPAFPGRSAARALGSLRRGRLLTAPGTTHFVPMERPEWLVEETLRFVGEEDPAPELPLRSRGLAHLALRVRDLEAVRDFYRDLFGMSVVWAPDPDNVYLSSGRDNLALHRVATEPPGGALDHLGFLVTRPAEVYAAADALAKRGIPVLQAPRRHRDGSCSLYLKDPAGNLVQILYTPDARLD